jgi:hypothetical protein
VWFWLFFLLPIGAIFAHAASLIAGRRGVSMRHHSAFYSGLLGLVILPLVPLLFLLAMPLPLVGPVKPGLEVLFMVSVAFSTILFASSVLLSVSFAFSSLRKADQTGA